MYTNLFCKCFYTINKSFFKTSTKFPVNFGNNHIRHISSSNVFELLLHGHKSFRGSKCKFQAIEIKIKR